MTLIKARRGRGSYFELVRQFPLRPLRNDADHATAVRTAVRLSGRETPPLSNDEADYLGALSILIDSYESLHHRIARRGVSGVDALKFLMAEGALGVSDVGRIIGSQSAASEVVSGKRSLSKAHVHRLAEHFKLSPALFL